MLRPLTSLRFVAAMLVFVWHCPVTRPYAVLFSTGYAGVTFFFQLSGFILLYTYGATFRESLGRGAMRKFYLARFARIYPVHIFAMIAVLALFALFGSPAGSLFHWTGVPWSLRIEAILAQTFLLQSWFPAVPIHFGVNGPDWSISDEAFFYALFPFIAWALLRAFNGVRPSVVLFCSLGLWAATTAALFFYQPTQDGWLIYALPVVRILDFIQGVLAGIAFLNTAKSTAWRNPTAAEFSGVLAIVLGIAISPLLPRSLHFSAAFIPLFSAAIYIFALRAGDISRLLSSAIFVKLGEISFAFYMVHLGVFLAYGSLLGWTHPATDFLAALAITLASAYFVYTFIEAPLRERIRGAAHTGTPQVLPAIPLQAHPTA